MVERVLDVWTHEGVIHHDQNSMAMGDISNGANIHQAECRVRRSLDPDELGLVGADQVLYMQLDAGREGHLDAVGGSHLGEVSVSSAVHIGDRDDMGAGGERLEDGCGGSRAGGEGKGILSVFEGCSSLLEVISGAGLMIAVTARLLEGAATNRLGLELRVYSYRPTGLPTLV